MDFKKFYYKKVMSTNNVAIRKIKSGIIKGIVISELQKNGRGQYGKKWISLKGNLFMSIFFEIKKKLNLKNLTKINCEIIRSSLSNCTKKKIFIKYPNDLLINKKKFCGILQEIISNKKKKFIIIGIGVNLLKNPIIKNYPTTSILNETGFKIKKSNLLKSIENNYSKRLKLFA